MKMLPRGYDLRSIDAPLATSRWANASEVLSGCYQISDLHLGVAAIPHDRALPILEQIGRFREEIVAHPDLNDDWRAEVLAETDAHIAALSATDKVQIGISDDRHIATFAQTRAGKGTSLIIPNLCLYPGSVLCIDPKGENAKITASRRGYGSKHCEGLRQTVCVLDPYDTTGLAGELKAAWNPLDLLKTDDPGIVDLAASIAESLIIRTDPEADHWDSSARLFIKALILYVADTQQNKPTRNLLTVYDLLMRGAVDQLALDRENMKDEEKVPDAFTYLLYLMERHDGFDGIIAGAATMLLGMGDRERGSVLSTARRNLEFLERKAIRSVLSHSSFEIDHLKRAPAGMTIYLCLPPQRMHDCGRWLRLLITMALERLYEIEEHPATGHPVLFLLEEFASLRHMEIIEHAAGYAAGFGVKLWVILQDLPQLKRHYPQSWETFLGNAGCIQAFANADASTLQYLSNRLGEGELSQMVKNVTSSLTASTNDPGEISRVNGILMGRGPAAVIGGSLNLMLDPHSSGQSASTTTAYNENIQKSPLLLPDEIERLFRRDQMTQIVLRSGERPLVLKRTAYHESALFAGLYDPPKGYEPAQRKDSDTDLDDLIANAANFMHDITHAIQTARS
ncbi:MAG: type IV secretory system conjugative DNA transfer family protein [Pseudomonadota bacterium]